MRRSKGGVPSPTISHNTHKRLCVKLRMSECTHKLPAGLFLFCFLFFFVPSFHQCLLYSPPPFSMSRSRGKKFQTEICLEHSNISWSPELNRTDTTVVSAALHSRRLSIIIIIIIILLPCLITNGENGASWYVLLCAVSPQNSKGITPGVLYRAGRSVCESVWTQQNLFLIIDTGVVTELHIYPVLQQPHTLMNTSASEESTLSEHTGPKTGLFYFRRQQRMQSILMETKMQRTQYSKDTFI